MASMQVDSRPATGSQASALVPVPTHNPISRDASEKYFKALRVREYRDRVNVISSIAWNFLGNRIACASAERSIRIWNPERTEARFSTELKGYHEKPVECIVWDPTHAHILASCSTDGTVRLWNVWTKQCLSTIRTGTENLGLSYSPNGKFLAVVGASGRLFIIETATNAVVNKYESPATITRAMWSNSGEVLVLTLTTGYIDVLDWPSLSPVCLLQAHRAAILCAEFDPRGRYLAVGSNDSLVSLWDIQEWICVRTYSRVSQPPCAISWSFDGAFLALCYERDDPVDILHIETGDFVAQAPRQFPYHATDVKWHPLKYWLAYAGDPNGLKILGSTDEKR
ncbi:WD40-repeat-containing domain protein [Dipodascopsis tothii]|uniref:WD40-repeat-containing domain protein n=1 Tax=Dipodascopsis tothii TaxID=44089 RepID=UPI0034CE69EF